jgi:DNA-binding transcriptional regulator YdaS (Cro superfamily)
MTNPALLKARAAAGGNYSNLARLLGISQSAVSQWKKKGSVPLRRALQIEALTGGQVTKEELRPDVFLDPGRVPEAGSDLALDCFPQPGACLDGRQGGSAGPSAGSRAAIVSACRLLMRAGQFRPSLRDCCIWAECSVPIGCGLFKTIEILHLEAADDAATRDAIVERVVGDERTALAVETLNRIVRAVVMGAG